MKRINIKKIFLFLIMLLPQIVLAEDYVYRGKEAKVVYIIGIVLLAIRIAVPILLIVMASIDLVEALVQNDDEDIKKVLKGIIPKVIVAISILTLPTLLLFILKLTNNTKLFSEYSKCLLRPTSCSVQMFEEPPEIINNDNGNEEPITIITPSTNNDKYDKVNYSNFKWKYYYTGKGPIGEVYNKSTPYAIWAPEDVNDLNGVSLPLIIWLHGGGQLESKDFTNVGLPKVVNNWGKTNLKPIPAIIIAPHTGNQWKSDREFTMVKESIEWAKSYYNIDSNNIVLMGHSMGGRGTVFLSYGVYNKYKTSYFSAIVAMTCNVAGAYPSDNPTDGYNYFSKVRIRVYSEASESSGFLDWLGKSDQFIYLKNTNHGNVPYKAMTQDNNNDGISDLISWLFNV